MCSLQFPLHISSFHTPVSYLWVQNHSKWQGRESMDFLPLSFRRQWLTMIALMQSICEVFFTQETKGPVSKIRSMLSRKLAHLLASWVEMVHHLTVLSGSARHSPRGERPEAPVSLGRTAAASGGSWRLLPLHSLLFTPLLSMNNKGRVSTAFWVWGQVTSILMAS